MHLPDGAASFVLIEPCARCATQSLSIDSHSQFFLDGRNVPLAVLRQRLSTNARWRVSAIYTPGDLRLTRLRASQR